MIVTLRDQAMSGMMVLLTEGVECSAKIAMTALPGCLAATRLLPEHDWPWRIFPEPHTAQICSS
jgi:hypothetical protein